MSDRELLDDDGENLALRTFLAFYGNNPTVTIGAMKYCMETSGWENHPEFINRMPDWGMTKRIAQMWIRHLLSLEQALAQPERDMSTNHENIDTSEKRVHGIDISEQEGCSNCAKKASDGWALLCVECAEKALAPEKAHLPVGMTCKVWTHGCALFDGVDLPNETLLYTAPPKREWVDLTDEEIESVRRKTFFAFQEAIASMGTGKADATNYAKNLIDAFKEKNT